MRDTSENNSPAVHKLPTENKQLVRTSPLRMSRSLTVLNPPTPSNPLVSIIMPVYNVSEWLDRSIYSALTQTYRNIEVIIVDDGSTDGSGIKADGWSLQDERIRVIHTPNRGVAAARNEGLAAAHGYFIYFFDPDDLIKPNLIELCLLTMHTQNADIVMFKFDTIGINGMPRNSRYVHNRYSSLQILSPKEAIKKQLRGQIGGYLWGFVARASIYHRGKITFPEGHVIEDTARICQILGGAHRIVRLPIVLYHYRLHKGSLMSQSGLLSDWKRATTERKAYVMAAFPELKAYARIQRLSPLNLDYESLRQNLIFGLGLDTDSAEHRVQNKMKRKADRRLLRNERKADRAIARQTNRQVRLEMKLARKAGKEFGTVDWSDLPDDDNLNDND